jgi:hypothetical protein
MFIRLATFAKMRRSQASEHFNPLNRQQERLPFHKHR